MLALFLAIVFTLGWFPLYVYRAENLSEALPQYSTAERFWVRVTPLAITLHVSAACILLTVGPPPSRVRVLTGLALFTSAVAFWLWARSQIGSLFVTRLPDQPPRLLRRDGPFGVVRHPLYFAYLIAAGSPALVAGRPILAVTFLGCVAVLLVRSAQEERRLHAQLGDSYADYCRSVSRLIPYVW